MLWLTLGRSIHLSVETEEYNAVSESRHTAGVRADEEAGNSGVSGVVIHHYSKTFGEL
jgi:hypothetical protein